MEAKLKPQDLRIGNLVLDESNKIAVVTSLDFERKFYHEAKEKTFIGSCSLKLLEKYEWNTSFGRWVENLKPIPLTEEWLLTFGFQKEDQGSVSVQFHYGENPVTKDHLISLIWIKDYKSNNNALEGFPFYRNGHFTIKTVNHLQNLYFALSGEELTLTETPCPEKK